MPAQLRKRNSIVRATNNQYALALGPGMIFSLIGA